MTSGWVRFTIATKRYFIFALYLCVYLNFGGVNKSGETREFIKYVYNPAMSFEHPTKRDPIDRQVAPDSAEALKREAAATIYRNLIETGIGKEIVSKSAHGARFGIESYTSIRLDYDTGDQKAFGGVYVQPRLHSASDTITPKLYRMYKDVNERNVAARRIWQGVTDQQKAVLFEEAIIKALAKWRGELEDSQKLAQSDDDEDRQAGERFTAEAEKQLQKVLDVEAAYKAGLTEFMIGADGAILATLRSDRISIAQ